MDDDHKPLNFDPPPPWTWKDFRPDRDLYFRPKKDPETSFYFDDKKWREKFTGPPCRVWDARNWPQRYLRGLVPSLNGNGTRL